MIGPNNIYKYILQFIKITIINCYFRFFKKTICQLCISLEPISSNIFNEFEKNINEHNLNISNIYTSTHYGHRRNSILNNLYYKSIPNKYIDEINIFFKKLNPYLYDKYLN